jgi:hypothetical protein
MITMVRSLIAQTQFHGTWARHHLPASLYPLLQALLAREHENSTLDVGYYSSKARTSLNPIVSCANHPSPTHDRYNFTAGGRESRHVGKDVQPLHSVTNCYNSCAHSYEWPGPSHG